MTEDWKSHVKHMMKMMTLHVRGASEKNCKVAKLLQKLPNKANLCKLVGILVTRPTNELPDLKKSQASTKPAHPH